MREEGPLKDPFQRYIDLAAAAGALLRKSLETGTNLVFFRELGTNEALLQSLAVAFVNALAGRSTSPPTVRLNSAAPSHSPGKTWTIDTSGVHCPLCDAPMKVRTRRSDGGEFLGCTDWPTCDGARSAPDGAYSSRVKARLAECGIYEDPHPPRALATPPVSSGEHYEEDEILPYADDDDIPF